MRYQVALILIALAVLTVAMAGCTTPAPVNRPCGVIRDSLGTVRATTPGGQQRLDIHFERGAAAGCWGR